MGNRTRIIPACSSVPQHLRCACSRCLWRVKIILPRAEVGYKNITTRRHDSTAYSIFSSFFIPISSSLPPSPLLFCNVHQEFISVFASFPSFALLIPSTAPFLLLHLLFPPSSTVAVIQCEVSVST